MSEANNRLIIMKTQQLIKLSLKALLAALTVSILLFGISSVANAQTVTPHKVVRIYNFNLKGNKAQEAQIKQSANWPILSTKLISKGIIKITFYTNANSY